MTLKKIFFTLALLLLITFGLQAGPTVIRDDRVQDLGVTPVLGRGYSIATSTFQSNCLTNVVTTKPSYNFHYHFEQLDSSGKKSSKTSSSGSARASGSTFGFDISSSGSASKTAIGSKEYHYQRILVTILMDVYYASVDETVTKMGTAASSLLTKKDIPGFFDSCGPYYVRSIGRFSKFVAMFTYMTETEKRDTKYEAALEISVKGWGQDYGASSAVSKATKSEMSNKSLTIDVAAYGLGKDKKASLISYDLKTFKAAIGDAFLSMQDEATGMVSTVEVVPWVENTEFQNLINLEETTDEKGKKVTLYMQKRILNQNAEFLAEVDRASRNKLNLYYKSNLCKMRLDKDFTNNKGKLLTGVLINNNTGKPGITIKQLSQKLDPPGQWKKYEDFVYKKVVKCIDAFMQNEKIIKVTPFTRIPACKGLEGDFADISGRDIDDHCMPRTSNVILDENKNAKDPGEK